MPCIFDLDSNEEKYLRLSHSNFFANLLLKPKNTVLILSLDK